MAYQIKQLESLDEAELRRIADELEIDNINHKNNEELIYAILDRQAAVSAGMVPSTSTRKRKRIAAPLKDEVVYTADKSGEAHKLEKDNTSSRRKKSTTKKEDNNIVANEKGATNKGAEENLKEIKTNTEKKGAEEKDKILIYNKENNVGSKQEETNINNNDNQSSNNTKISIEDTSDTNQQVSDSDIELPDFIAAQLQTVTQDSSEQIAQEDIEKVKQTLENVNKQTLENDNEEKEVAEISYPEIDFIITQDIPESPLQLSSNTTFEEELNYPKFRKFKEDPLVQQRINNTSEKVEDIFIEASGVLEVVSEGYGFLRSADYNYLSSPDDIYVSGFIIKTNGLSNGDVVEGKVRIPRAEDKFYVLDEIISVNGVDPKIAGDRVAFEHLTPLFPEEKFTLCDESGGSESCRIVDMFAPIGKGQRALIVAQPKTGKTWLMKDIANAIAKNNPEAYLMMLLIDERPEEVTDMERTVKAEVIASTFDESAQHHVKIAGIVLDKAKRMVECGHDVVIFLDSITRLARAYNTVSPSSGKVLSGGVEANSLQYPKRFFGAARNIEGGGSLTIIATALIDTGSKMDEVIFEEFKGTGNMELQLDRNLANKRIYPAVNLVASSTRRDDLLFDEMTQNRMWILRKFIADMNPLEAMNELKRQMKGTKNNEEFLNSMNG